MGTNLIFGFSLFTICIFLSFLFEWFYKFRGLQFIICCHALVLLIQSIGMPFKALMQRNYAFKPLAIGEFVGTVMSFVVSLWLAIGKWGALSLVAGWATQYAVTVLYYGVSNTFIPGFRPKFNWIFTKKIIIKSKVYWGERLISNLAGSLDILVLGKLLGEDLLGIYEVLKRILFRIINIISSSIEKVIFPLLCANSNNPSALRSIYFSGLSTIAILVAPIVAILYFNAYYFMEFFGLEWQTQASLLSFFALWAIIHALLAPIDVFYASIDRIKVWQNANLLFILFTSLLLFSIRHQSMNMILNSFLSAWTILMLLFYGYFLRKKLNYSFIQLFREIFLPFLLTFLLAYLIDAFTNWSIIPSLFVLVAGYLAIIWYFLPDKVEIFKSLLFNQET